MAPVIPVKTYSRRQLAKRRNSIEVFDALFAENIRKRKEAESTKKRRKKPIVVKELPPPDENHHLIEDSINRSWGLDDTFDKICKNPVYQNSKTKTCHDDSDTDKNFLIPDNMTDNADKEVISKCEKTLDKSVNISLFVERVPAHKPAEFLTFSSLSTTDEHMGDCSKNNSITSHSYKPFFSKTFVNQSVNMLSLPCTAIANSTPIKLPREINDTISPIFKDVHEKSLMEKSYEEIKAWNFKPPDFKQPLAKLKFGIGNNELSLKKCKRPVRKFVKRKNLRSSASTTNFENILDSFKEDWKLRTSPKVILDKDIDILGITGSVNTSSLFLEVEGLVNESENFSETRSNSKRRRAAASSKVNYSTDKDSDEVTENEVLQSVRLRVLRPQKTYSRISYAMKTSSTTNQTSVTNVKRGRSKSSARVIDISSEDIIDGSPKRVINTSICSIINSRRNNFQKDVWVTVRNKPRFSKRPNILRRQTLKPKPKSAEPKRTEKSSTASDVEVVLSFHNYSKKFDDVIEIVSSDEEEVEKPETSLENNVGSSTSKVATDFENEEVSKINVTSPNKKSPQEKVYPRRKVLSKKNESCTPVSKSSYNCCETTFRRRKSSRRRKTKSRSGTSSRNKRTTKQTENKNVTPTNDTRSDTSLSSDSQRKNKLCLGIPLTPTEKKVVPIMLKPGKLYRRSLLEIKRRRSTLYVDDTICIADKGCICFCQKCNEDANATFSANDYRMSIKVVPECPSDASVLKDNISVLENYATSLIHSVIPEENSGDRSVVRTKESCLHEPVPLTARDIVLQRCGQTEPIPFGKCYSPRVLKNCFKIGEGVYGEVFLFRNASGTSSVMKIIPIEGNQMVNGEHQKKFDEILSEIVIAMELSNLRNATENNTSGFSEVQKIRCVQGCYPPKLIDLWRLYEESNGTENDPPEMFTDDQLYIVLELGNGGQDMEAFIFTDAVQTLSLFKQTACALAVAEAELQFEHRDLHWGNILILQRNEIKKLKYRLNGMDVEVDANGVTGCIIDFTLSRITYDGVCIYNDLSADPDLFTAAGDYQFDIYRKMAKHNRNEWQHFEPYTNVLWLHYLLDKMIKGVRYDIKNRKEHQEHMLTLRKLHRGILQYKSAADIVISEFVKV